MMNKKAIIVMFALLVIGLLAFVFGSAFGDSVGKYGYLNIENLSESDLLVRNVIINDNAQYNSTTSMGNLDVDIPHKKYVDDSFGFGFEHFTSMEESSTSSSIPISKIDVTTTSKEPGLYRIGYSAEVAHNFGGESIIVELLVNGVSIHNHTNGNDNLQIFDIDSDMWETLSGVYYLNITSPQTIGLNLTFASGGDTARMSNSVIEIWRVEQ